MFRKILEQRWLYHVVFWPALVVPFILILGGQENLTYWQAFRDIMLQAMAYAVMVYINLLYLIPEYFQKRKFGQYFALLALFMVLTVPLHALADYYSDLKRVAREMGSITYFDSILGSTINMMVMVGLTTALKFAKKWFTHQQETQELERQRLQAELKYLKAQINPHFLFNTLNNLYSLTLQKSDLAPEMVLKLSDMMRYMLYHSNEKQVSLEKEITYMKYYIDLERIRQTDKTDVRFDINEEPNGQMIAPLLLIPFLENSFKHGVNNNTEAGWVHIDLQIHGNELDFNIANSKPKSTLPKLNGKDHGIGLQNVRRRLDLLYPKQYSLEIEDEPDHYKTELKLHLE